MSTPEDRRLGLAHALDLASADTAHDVADVDSIVVAADKFATFLSEGVQQPAAKTQAEDRPGYQLATSLGNDGKLYASGFNLGGESGILQSVALKNVTPESKFGEEDAAFLEHAKMCPGCADMSKDLATAGFPTMDTPVMDVAQLSREVREQLVQSGVMFFGQLIQAGPQMAVSLDTPEQAHALLDFMGPVADFLQKRYSGEPSGEAHDSVTLESSYSGLTLDSFSDIGPLTFQVLNRAGFNTIGDVTHNLEKLMPLLTSLPSLKDTAALVGHVVTNLRHDIDESGHSMTSPQRQKAEAQVKELETLVNLTKRVVASMPEGGEKPSLSEGSQRLLDLLTGGKNLGGGRFLVNSANPEVEAMLAQVLEGKVLTLGLESGVTAQISGRKLDRTELAQMDPDLRAQIEAIFSKEPGSNTKH